MVQEKDVGGIGYRKSDTFGKSVQDAHCAVDLDVGPDGGHTGGTCKNDARASVARIFKPALEDVMMNTLTEAEDRMVPAGIRPMKFQLNESDCEITRRSRRSLPPVELLRRGLMRAL